MGGLSLLSDSAPLSFAPWASYANTAARVSTFLCLAPGISDIWR